MFKNMKQSHRYQADPSSKTGKKGRKLKKNQSVEACKCVTPFVKLHWWDCPEVNKPCPIHGNVLYQNMKPEKVEPDQNVTISFHPSSRTEKLFEPVKALLAQCDPDTKINFQYFSPHCFKEKEYLKNQTIQTSFEDLGKCVSNSVFVEKKKSGYENTNKMKKLKECFHSPCNSIAQKYPSPTSVRRNFNNENSFEESAQPWHKFFNDTNYNKNSEWFASNPFGYKKFEKLAGDKRSSDFVTVTQQDDKIINHKIYEIDHRKGFNENIISGFGNQETQIAYSSFNVKYPNEPNNYTYNRLEEKETQGNTNGENRDIFDNSPMSTSSAGSVYVTPFFLMPDGLDTSDDECEEIYSDRRSIGVQVKDGDFDEKGTKAVTRYVQKSEFESDSNSERKMNEVALQTDCKMHRCKEYSTYVESSDENLSDICDEKIVQTNIRKNVRINREKKNETKLKSTEIQTTNLCQQKEVLITRYNTPKKETGNQFQSCACGTQDFNSKLNKSTTTSLPSSNKQIQRLSESEDVECQNYYYDVSVKESYKSQNAPRPENEGKTSPVSDLSELKRLIFEFFDRATCNCKEKEIENEARKKDKKVMSTMTESVTKEDDSKRANVMNKEVQTYERAEKTPEVKQSAQCRQIVQQDDDCQSQIKTCDDVCPFCGREIRRLSLSVSTNTEDILAVKEKTTIIETGVTEITKIKKRACPENSLKKSIATSTNQSGKPRTNTKSEFQKTKRTNGSQSPTTTRNAATLVAPCSTSWRNDKHEWSNFHEDNEENLPTSREPKLVESEMFFSMQDTKHFQRGNKRNQQDDETYLDESQNRKDDQKRRNRQTSKGPKLDESELFFSMQDTKHFQRGNKRNQQDDETYPDESQNRKDDQKRRSRQTSREPKLDESELFFSMQDTKHAYRENKRNQQDDETNPDESQSRKDDQKRRNRQTSREPKLDESELFFSMQDTKHTHRGNKRNQQDDETNPDESHSRKDDQKRRSRQYYHVSVNPAWPRDLTNTWKTQDEKDESVKQKRSQKAVLEKDLQAEAHPPKVEESPQNFESGQQNEKTKNRGHRKRNNFGIIRIPYSSASQLSLNKSTHLQSKVIKSEESVNTLNQNSTALDCTTLKIFGEDANNLFTVKSCHLNPLRIAYDDQSCDKLLTCSFCKSLMLIKVNNKNEGFAYVPGLNDATRNQNTQSESDEVPERQSYEKFALPRQNVDEQESEKSSNSSDFSARTLTSLKGRNSDLES